MGNDLWYNTCAREKDWRDSKTGSTDSLRDFGKMGAGTWSPWPREPLLASTVEGPSMRHRSESSWMSTVRLPPYKWKVTRSSLLCVKTFNDRHISMTKDSSPSLFFLSFSRSLGKQKQSFFFLLLFGRKISPARYPHHHQFPSLLAAF